MRSVSDVLPPRLPAVCMVSGNLNSTWFDLNTPTGQHGKWFEKYSLHSIFTFYLNRDTSVTELFPVVVFKKNIPCWLIYRQWIETVSDCGRKIRNDVDTDTYYCRPEFVSWWWINITVFYTRFLSPTDQKYAESSMYWQFFYYRPPGKFLQRARSLKCDAENLTYSYIYYIYIVTVSIIIWIFFM